MGSGLTNQSQPVAIEVPVLEAQLRLAFGQSYLGITETLDSDTAERN